MFPLNSLAKVMGFIKHVIATGCTLEYEAKILCCSRHTFISRQTKVLTGNLLPWRFPLLVVKDALTVVGEKSDQHS